ncbi:hypothetical protein GOP47_0026308 [Adiantum capillus-veneris]|nr:hypothetical protein GOP47_0026308 [Adiantum capillus-veneris]
MGTKKRKLLVGVGVLLAGWWAAAAGVEGANDLSLILPATYSIFVAAANAVNITPYNLPPFYTIFAPLNSAFERLACLTDPTANKTLTSAILKYHMVNNPHDYANTIELATARNPWMPRSFFNSYQLSIFFETDTTLISINNRSWVVSPDVTNYATLSVHGIDTVLIPPRVKLPSGCNTY